MIIFLAIVGFNQFQSIIHEEVAHCCGNMNWDSANYYLPKTFPLELKNSIRLTQGTLFK